MIDWENTATWRVLVVDDEADNLEVVAETLEFRGAEVRTAKDGQDGIAVLQDFEANLILLDLSMPRMNGWQMRKILKSRPETQEIPILALSAHAMAGDKTRAIEAGFDGYLTKPVNIITLLNDIRTAAKEKVE